MSARRVPRAWPRMLRDRGMPSQCGIAVYHHHRARYSLPAGGRGGDRTHLRLARDGTPVHRPYRTGGFSHVDGHSDVDRHHGDRYSRSLPTSCIPLLTLVSVWDSNHDRLTSTETFKKPLQHQSRHCYRHYNLTVRRFRKHSHGNVRTWTSGVIAFYMLVLGASYYTDIAHPLTRNCAARPGQIATIPAQSYSHPPRTPVWHGCDRTGYLRPHHLWRADLADDRPLRRVRGGDFGRADRRDGGILWRMDG